MKKMNLPNKLTVLRMILVPVFMAVLLLWNRWVALAIFIAASLTDLVDGKIARARGLVTDFGKFMDPLADKLLVISAMVIFVEQGTMPSWVCMVVIARELAVSGLRMVAASHGTVMAAGWSGKIKTACTMVGLCVMMVPRVADIAIVGSFTVNTLMWIVILVTTVVSGVEYFAKNGSVLVQGKI